MVWLHIVGSVMLVSFISIAAALPLLIKKKIPELLLLSFLSFSVGTLLGSVFIHFLPEVFADNYSLSSAIYILVGFMVFFILEKFIHWHHDKDLAEGHGHAYHLAPVNLAGDGIHNFLDGMVIAGSYLVSIPLGVAATISVAFHEIPQEVADFGVLIYAGLSKSKAVLFNFYAAITALLGAFIGIFLSNAMISFEVFIVPFAAGSFLYIAASNLVPELHTRIKLSENIIQIFSIVLGIGVMVLLSVFGP